MDRNIYKIYLKKHVFTNKNVKEIGKSYLKNEESFNYLKFNNLYWSNIDHPLIQKLKIERFVTI